MQLKSSLLFRGVCEWNNEFLALFPHRFDYIWAEHPNRGAPVEWKTECRHPLSDRLISQGAYLYGVRFGTQTNYCLLDIDSSSSYHPNHDPFAISRIGAALEPLGLVNYLACTSSYSGGLHLYFPFQQAQSSWQLAIAVASLLENAGFKLQAGQLEVFPNPKPYSSDGTLSLFNAHRLPLQIGSYLLDNAFQPVWSDTHSFVQQWQLFQQRNDISSRSLKQILKQVKRRHFGISGKAEKFVNDLNAEIEIGWTGSGQTNRLLGRITMRAYIFHHVLSGGEPLQGTALVEEIVEVAKALPGYEEWCRHQHEIDHRAEEWAHCIENSHYFHFGEQSKQQKPQTQDPELTAAIERAPSWNQRQAAATRERIRGAIAALLEQNTLPARPTARFQALLKYGIGGGSLYRHRNLWHPNYFGIETDSNIELANTELRTDKDTNALPNYHSSPSLFSPIGGDNPPAAASGDSSSSTFTPIVSNRSQIPTLLPPASELEQEVHPESPTSLSLAAQDAFREASRLAHAQHQSIAAQAAQQQVERMQQFLDSGDPILVAEAMAWAQLHPNVLSLNPLQLSLLCNAPPRPLHSRSAILVAIAAQFERLQWSNEQLSHALNQHFRKPHLELLNDFELMRWLAWICHAT